MNKKRLIFIVIIVAIIIGLLFINSKFNNKSTISDAMKFKEEYESLIILRMIMVKNIEIFLFHLIIHFFI